MTLLLAMWATGLTGPAAADAPAAGERCTYSVWRWDVNRKAAVDLQRVDKARAEVTPAERDADTGCSVCEQDQRWLEVPGLPRVQVCAVLAPRIESALRTALAEGARIDSLVGYRPGYTRGDVDAAGRRTGLSNHSFGISVDVDAEHNGLYHGCARFGPHCRLVRGGPWSAEHPRSLHPAHPVVRALRAIGLAWGGEITGDQKDFMHFSPSGY